jgi:hypothetical protein
MKQSITSLRVAVMIYALTVFVLSNTLALISFSERMEWKVIIMSAFFSFLTFSLWFIPLIPILFAFFLCGRKLHWSQEAFLFYTVIAVLCITVVVFVFFSLSDFTEPEEHEGLLPTALFASGITIFMLKGAIRRLARPPVLSENLPTDDNPLNTTN